MSMDSSNQHQQKMTDFPPTVAHLQPRPFLLPDGAVGLLYPGGHIEMNPAKPPVLSPEQIDDAQLLGLTLIGPAGE